MGRPAKVLDLNVILEMHFNECQALTRIARDLGVHTERVVDLLRSNGYEPINMSSRFGSKHHRWKGGRNAHRGGYVLVTLPENDPFRFTSRTGSVFEHRYVMMKHLGRALTRDETVHHIDGDRKNNAIENLQLRTSAHGPGIVLTCTDCGSHNVTTEKLADGIIE